jgi:hypothetical protein
MRESVSQTGALLKITNCISRSMNSARMMKEEEGAAVRRGDPGLKDKIATSLRSSQ